MSGLESASGPMRAMDLQLTCEREEVVFVAEQDGGSRRRALRAACALFGCDQARRFWLGMVRCKGC